MLAFPALESSLALGILYAEGAALSGSAFNLYLPADDAGGKGQHRYKVRYVPAALALRQRTGIPGIHSTFGTRTELLNSLRLIYSRLANHRCPNGYYLEPTLDVAAGCELVCPRCGAAFFAPSAEEPVFNSLGASRRCDGTGTVRTVDRSTLVPDKSLSIDGGGRAVEFPDVVSDDRRLPRYGRAHRRSVPRAERMGKRHCLQWAGRKKHIFYKSKNSNQAGELDFTYYNAVYTVENALAKVKDEQGMKQVEKFLKQEICPDCGGSRLLAAAWVPKVRGVSLEEACRMPLAELAEWVNGIPASLEAKMCLLAESICESFRNTVRRLLLFFCGSSLQDDRRRSRLPAKKHNK